VMMQYSLLDRRPEEEMFSFLHDNQVAVLARGTIAKGLLVSKPADSYLNYSAEQVGKAALAIKSVADTLHSPFQTAVQFVLQHTSVNAAVIGIRTEGQLREALDVFRYPSLNTLQMEILGNTLPGNKYLEHR
jgi:aryl-alcohol dehydrogenase-like predicted oxidoreductase